MPRQKQDKIFTSSPAPSTPETPRSTIDETPSLQPLFPPSSNRKRDRSVDCLPNDLIRDRSPPTKVRRIEDTFPQWRSVRDASPCARIRLLLRNTEPSRASPIREIGRSPKPSPIASRDPTPSPPTPESSDILLSNSNDQQVPLPSAPLPRSSKPSAPQKPNSDFYGTLSSIKSAIFRPRSQSIFPPIPETDAAEFTTHKLHSLASPRLEKLAKYYNPVEITREINPLERGYWEIPIPKSLSGRERDKFHEYVEACISQGKWGWGTWMEPVLVDSGGKLIPIGEGEGEGEGREEEMRDLWEGRRRSFGHGRGKGRGLVLRRFWCWGEVVREVWLAVLLGGVEVVKGVGTRWVDGRGEVVVRMEGGKKEGGSDERD